MLPLISFKAHFPDDIAVNVGSLEAVEEFARQLGAQLNQGVFRRDYASATLPGHLGLT